MSGIEVLSRTQRVIILPNTSVSIVKEGPTGPAGSAGIQGPAGSAGSQGLAGSDANVTEANVEAVIGPRNGFDGYLGLDAQGLIPDERVSESIVTQVELDTAISLLQPLSDKGQPLGYVELDNVGKIPSARLPALAITDVFPVVSEAAMLALVAERGDVAIRSDINATFILSDEPATILSNWLQLPIPGDAVLSVQGQIGVVTLPEDGPIGTASLRTLGTGAQQALPGTDPRLRLPGSSTEIGLDWWGWRGTAAQIQWPANYCRIYSLVLPAGNVLALSSSVMIGEVGAVVRVVAYSPNPLTGRPEVLRAYADIEAETTAYKAVILAEPFFHPGGALWVATYPIVGTPTLRQMQFVYGEVRPGTLTASATASVITDGGWYINPMPNPPPNPLPKTLFNSSAVSAPAIVAVKMEVFA